MKRRIVVSVIAVLLACQLNGQTKGQFKGIVGVGNGLKVGTDWVLQYGVDGGVQYELSSGFALMGLIDYERFTFSSGSDHTAVLSDPSNHSISILGSIVYSPEWRFAPFISTGIGISSIARDDVYKYQSINQQIVKVDGGNGVASFLSYSFGLHILMTDAVRIFIEAEGRSQFLDQRNLYPNHFRASGGLKFLL